MSGAGEGGASDDCSAPIDEAYCTTVTGYCAADTYTVEQCKAVAIAQRCGIASACIAEQDAVEQCAVTGTPVCDDAYTVISDIDCAQESAAFYDCVGYVWSCSNESTRCYCLHDAPASAKDSTCTNLFDCCFTDLFGASCACYEQSVCDASSEELYPRVPSCPQT
jgi:hypothetical protein